MAIALGVFLIAFSGLLFEVALTRIFSATIWYHFAFVAISVALLGWGLGGFAVHLLRKGAPPTAGRAAFLSLVYAATIPLSLWLIVRIPFRPDLLWFYFLASLVPFFFAGMALSTVFALHRERAGTLYFGDLLGASLGAIAVTLLLSGLGGEGAVVAAALPPLVAAACFSRRLLPASLAGILLLGAALVFHSRTGTFLIRSAPAKGMYRHLAAHPEAEIALTGWNAYSRIDAVTGLGDALARLYIDSDAWTNLHAWDGKVESVGYMREWYRALPFRLAPGGNTLVIGPGGGSDLLVALAAGSPTVTAVEMNPLMLRFVRQFGAQAGNLYDHPQVETILSEGRNYLSRSDRRFGVVFLGFVDSWASVASGGLSLAENYLYTTEAFRAYYDHLTDDGLLVIMRWDVDVPRLVTNSVALLGPEAAAQRVAVLMEKRGTPEDPPQMIFILKKRPFTEAETAMMVDGWTSARPVIVPGRVAEPPYDALLSGRTGLEAWVAASHLRVDPVFDERPFFFARQKPWGIPKPMATGLLWVLTPVLCLLGGFALLGKPRGERPGPYLASLVYFASLGFGFIAVELCLLQRLTLLLGHPIFTLSILLFTLLAASGLGSAFSARFSVRLACLVVAGLGAIYAVALPGVVTALLPLSLAARIAAAILLVAPLGFVMGMPFPSGLRRVGQGPFPAPPFYWGLNGVLSVVGSVVTVLLAVTWGFRLAALLGAACYLLAAASSSALERRAASE
ncbi:MAG TPA: hypothetical protein VJU18_11160 [Vicinamibacteria bacterium]|nr:hypothetical protein [Vicinamibacteria bacterium]